MSSDESPPLAGFGTEIGAAGVSGVHAAALLRSLGAEVRAGTTTPTPTPGHDWAASGAMWLTGLAAGPPALPPGAPASAVRGALTAFALLTQARTGKGVSLPGPALLGERAACARLSRNAPWSPGGAFRCVPTLDGWIGISLARPADLDLVPALVQAQQQDDPWSQVTAWARGCGTTEAVDRAQLLGLPAAAVPGSQPSGAADPQLAHRGDAWLLTHPGGRAHRRTRPLVVDLTSLWAGPLCARLLVAAGCRVVKVESTSRPDGTRLGPAGFYDLLHAGAESVALDLSSNGDVDALRRLVASADVVLEGSRPRALQQLGVDAAAAVEAGTTWLSLTAYGRTGPWANRVGFGDDVAVAAGLVVRCAEGCPLPCGDAIADPLAGVHAAVAVAAALLDDRAHLLDLSMRDVAAGAVRLAAPHCRVQRSGQGWLVVDESGSARVRRPRCPPVPAQAAPLGAHTATVLAQG